MSIDLSILIPTWDRPEEVNKRLREIDNIWQGAVKIIIQVNPGNYNASNIDTSLHRGTTILQQNNHNFGLIGNICYGITRVDTPWLWILGDDDKVRTDANSQIDQAIRLANEHSAMGVLFNQWHRGATEKDHPILSRSIETLLESSSFGDMLFISGFVWRFSFFQENLSIFLDYAYSCASHTLILLASQAEGRSTIAIIDYPLIDYEYAVTWSRLVYLQRITSIFIYPSLRPFAIRSKLTDILWPHCRWALLSAAHDQLKHGEITMADWYGAAVTLSLHALSSSKLKTALARIIDILLIPLEIYSPWYLISLPIKKSVNFFRGLLRPARRSRRGVKSIEQRSC
ncbi:MAG: glycosyltransferase family 2 protein [Cyanobacteriota bacterium]|jgi:glycosyltransferase involved in cell wall biosynthesis